MAGPMTLCVYVAFGLLNNAAHNSIPLHPDLRNWFCLVNNSLLLCMRFVCVVFYVTCVGWMGFEEKHSVYFDKPIPSSLCIVSQSLSLDYICVPLMLHFHLGGRLLCIL